LVEKGRRLPFKKRKKYHIKRFATGSFPKPDGDTGFKPRGKKPPRAAAGTYGEFPTPVAPAKKPDASLAVDADNARWMHFSLLLLPIHLPCCTTP
jgi:hypothetical protein